VSRDTIKRALSSMQYSKCIACRKGWVNRSLGKKRKEFAEAIKTHFTTPDSWKVVRFSNEVHFALGPQGRIYIIRKPGEKYCADCIQYRNEPSSEEKDMNKIHAWAAVQHDFKSPLVFYNIKSNTNGKMTQQAYIDQILEPYVRPWLRGKRFILEEDNNSGHGPSRQNIVRTWKQNADLEQYFNCSNSPDLALIENCWQTPKQYVKKFPHWNEQDTKELALEGWEKVSHDFINDRINSMPQRIQDCIDLEGQITAW
jgi:hypothetical protein